MPENKMLKENEKFISFVLSFVLHFDVFLLRNGVVSRVVGGS